MAPSKKVWVLAIVGLTVMALNLAGISYLHLPVILSTEDSSEITISSVTVESVRTTQVRNQSSTSSSSSSTARSMTEKLWPSSVQMPSFLPWSARPHLKLGSCEGYFGNGFLRKIDVLSRAGLQFQKDEEIPSLKCLYSDTLRTSVCEARRIVLHPERISMARGGEALDSVMGRQDAEELPDFSAGAFELLMPTASSSRRTTDFTINSKLIDDLLPQGHIHDHRLRSLFNNIRTVSSNDIPCTQEVRTPTLLIIRYEYANLFHTATDWYSAYVSSRVLDLKHPPNVVFVDGHCESPMDDGWTSLFNDVKYAKHFNASVCFDHVIFTPLGYETALFKGLKSGIPCKGCSATELEQNDDDMRTARLREFGEFFKASFNILNSKPKDVIKILLIRRESYFAHPRHRGKPEVRLQNEQELLEEMKKWAKIQSQKDHHGRKMDIQIIDGTLAHMKMKDQVQAVHDASMIVGVHGAGLTHILFAQPGTVVLEILSPLFMRPHYSHISHWMDLEYHSITMQGIVVNTAQVLEKLASFLDKVTAGNSLTAV